MKCRLLLFYTTTTNHFSISLWHVMKSGFYTIASNDQLSSWTKKKLQSTFQSRICTQKKFMVTLWWSATRLIHYSFLNPRETIISEKYAQQINEMHWKLQCLQPALVNRLGPILFHDNAWPHIAQPILQKLNYLGYEVLPSPTIFTWPLTNQLSLLQAS